MKEKLILYLELSKVKITGAVAFTTFTGYLLANQSLDAGFVLPTFGLFLLACGSSVINHLQEFKTDARMVRTQLRPLPSGKVSISEALLLAVFEVIAGTLILWFTANPLATLLGIIALIWYNGIYTNLKKITAHAVIPGSVIGAIPPLVGWVTAGGALNTSAPWIIALFFFIWQVPHFYLLALKYGNQYDEAGFPTLTQKHPISYIQRIIFIWVLLTIVSAIFLAHSAINGSWVVVAGIYLSSIWLLVKFISFSKLTTENLNPGKYFMQINYYVLLVIILLNVSFLLP